MQASGASCSHQALSQNSVRIGYIYVYGVNRGPTLDTRFLASSTLVISDAGLMNIYVMVWTGRVTVDSDDFESRACIVNTGLWCESRCIYENVTFTFDASWCKFDRMPLHIYIWLLLCGGVGPTLVHQRVRDSCLIRARCVCIEIDTSSMQPYIYYMNIYNIYSNI